MFLDWQAKEYADRMLDGIDCDGSLERCPSTAINDEAEDYDGKTETDVREHVMTPSGSSDGGGEPRDNTMMEEVEAPEVAKDATVEEGSPAKESAESGKTREETQLGAETTDAKTEPFAIKAKNTVSREPVIEAGGIKADEDDPEGLGLQFKQCDQSSPKQQTLDAHTPDAHPSEAFKAEIIKLIEDRFNALVEEQSGSARREPEHVVGVQSKASTPPQEMVIRETTEARAQSSQETNQAGDANSQETTVAKSQLTQEATKTKVSFLERTSELRPGATSEERQAQKSYDLRMRRSQEEYDLRMLRLEEDYDTHVRRSQEDHDHNRLESKQTHDRHKLELQKIFAPSGGKNSPSN